MAKINDGTLKDWKNGDKFTSELYEADREILRVAINDTDTKTNTNTTNITAHDKRLGDLEYNVTGTVVPMTFKELGMQNLTFDDIKLGYVDRQIEKAWQPMFDSFVKGIAEEFTATEGQTVFTLTNGYTPGTSQISVEVDGVPQDDDSFTETGAYTVTLSEGVPAGARVVVTIGKVQPNADARFESLADAINAKVAIPQQDTPPADAVTGTIWLDTSDNEYQGTVFQDLSDQLDDIAINIKSLGVKGDGVTDDTVAINNAFLNNPNKIIYFPDGDYRITAPIRITKDNSIKLSKKARIFADATMTYMFDFNTDRTISSIYDLSKDCFITGGSFDGNDKASDILRVNKFLHFTIDSVEFKNGVTRGLVVNDTNGMAAELIGRNLHFINYNTTNLNNTAISNLGTDNHFENIVTVDWTIGIYDKGNAVIDKFHYWISHQARIQNSIAFQIDSSSSINESFADTARTAFKVLSGNPRISLSKVYYNTSVYDSTNATSYPALVLDVISTSNVLFNGNRVIGNLTPSTTFINGVTATTVPTNITSLNNVFEQTVLNKFSAYWDLPYMNGVYAMSSGTLKGSFSATSTGINLFNQTSAKQFKLADDGSLTYGSNKVMEYLSGTTANRPASGTRFVGMRYFDTSLNSGNGMEIVFNGTNWINPSTGATV